MTPTELLAERDRIARRLAAPNLTPDETDHLVAEADRVRSTITAHNSRTALLGGSAVEHRSTPGTTGGTRYTPQPEQPTNLGAVVAAFAESEQVAGFRSNGYRGTARLEFPTLDTRAVITSEPTSGGAFLDPMRVPGATLTNLDRVPRIVDLIDQRDTTQNAVEWVRDNTPAGTAAAEVAEGALKPEASYVFEDVVDPVRTVAHWVPITRQAMDDSPALRQHVEGRLMYGLDFRIDAQVLNGNGTAPNLRGIMQTTGRSTYDAPAGEAAIISVRKAITVAQQAEAAPDAVVMHPTDWERIELSMDSQGLFRVSPSVAGALAPRIWGLNVVPTTVIAGSLPDPDGAGAGVATGGKFLVGAFRQGATLWNRDMALLVSDSHADYFTSNKLVILAERRVALSVVSPRSFVEGTLAPGTN